MEFCKFQKCAVCSDIKYRPIFKYIFKDRYPEVKICHRASYKVTNNVGKSFIVGDLSHIREGTKGFYIIDLYTGMPIYLSNENFKILCGCSSEYCNAIDYVAIYSTKSQ